MGARMEQRARTLVGTVRLNGLGYWRHRRQWCAVRRSSSTSIAPQRRQDACASTVAQTGGARSRPLSEHPLPNQGACVSFNARVGAVPRLRPIRHPRTPQQHLRKDRALCRCCSSSLCPSRIPEHHCGTCESFDACAGDVVTLCEPICLYRGISMLQPHHSTCRMCCEGGRASFDTANALQQPRSSLRAHRAA